MSVKQPQRTFFNTTIPASIIAEKIGVSRPYVSMILSGKRSGKKYIKKIKAAIKSICEEEIRKAAA